MDALFSRFAAPLVFVVSGLIPFTQSHAGAGFRTQNFTVDAPTPQLAREIGLEAERLRSALANEWLAEELPPWSKPCPIKARVAPQLGAGGATSFVFDRGEVFGWRMEIQGSRERILDSVLPHEITHTIFACHFRQPLPRWADEGACTTVEHKSEISKQERMLIEFLHTHRGIPFDRMFNMTEYPDDVLPLYAQGHSLAKYLIDLRGKRDFLAFLEDGLKDSNWPRALGQWYGYRDLGVLQNKWLDWVKQGRPAVQLASNDGARLAPSVDQSVGRLASSQVLRGQDPGSSRQNLWNSRTISNQPSIREPAAEPSRIRQQSVAQGSARPPRNDTHDPRPTIYEALASEATRR